MATVMMIERISKYTYSIEVKASGEYGEDGILHVDRYVDVVVNGCISFAIKPAQLDIDFDEELEYEDDDLAAFAAATRLVAQILFTRLFKI